MSAEGREQVVADRLRECHVCFAVTAPAREWLHLDAAHREHVRNGAGCHGCRVAEGRP